MATTPISATSTAKDRLALTAIMLPEPAKNTTAVWMRVYREFMPSRQGVTMVLLMMDWNTMEAPPMAKAVISMAMSLGARIFMEKSTSAELEKFTATSI